jgi:hypothetical protein
VEGPKDYQQRMKTAADMRKDIEATFQVAFESKTKNKRQH